MLQGHTEEELLEMGEACRKKYEKLEVETLKKALTGEIGTNTKMVKELEYLNKDYLDEMVQFEEYTFDLNPQTIEIFKNAEEDGENVITCARRILEVFAVCDKALNKTVYTNKDGQVCDEHGVPLNEDWEHSLFETIKGGGTDNERRETLNNPTTLGVIKGGKK